MQNLLKNLFSYESSELPGTKIFLHLFELFVVVNALIYVWEWAIYILKISDVVLPLGMARYINIEFFYGNHLAIYNAILITILLLAAFFFKKIKWLYAIAFLLIHLEYVARYSQGEIPHSHTLLGLSVLGLAIGSMFISSKQKSVQFALGFVFFFIGLGYTSASFCKLIATGIHWSDGSHLWLWISEKSADVLSTYGHYHLNEVQRAAMNHRWVGTLFLTIGWCTELSAVLLWWKKFRPFIFLLILGLHTGIFLTMNIIFFYYTIEMILIGFPWYLLLNNIFDERMLESNNRFLRFLTYRN